MNDQDVNVEMLAETENFSVLKSIDENGAVYHVELGGVSLHLIPEEWDELVVLIKDADN
ncbi:MAG: hypothetical protein AAF633_17780 [Chloroflexota bacterium]